jgi:hypothetical protein
MNRLDAFLAESEDRYLPDLTLWHRWHASNRTLPSGWDRTLPGCAAAIGAPAWIVWKPWDTSYDGATTSTTHSGKIRRMAFRADDREIYAIWQRGPDRDWWQTRYPVNDLADLDTALAVARARRYVVRTGNRSDEALATTGILAIELPMSPLSDLFHTLLGWNSGLELFLGEGRERVEEVMAALGRPIFPLVEQLADLPCDVLLVPDNLDGQYVSPRFFRQYIARVYTAISEIARDHGKRLAVHAGGPVRRLLPLLAESGVDMAEGVAGPPQSDAPLDEARQAAGVDLILWGGLPQDFLLETRSAGEFEDALAAAAALVRRDPRALLGVADRVPPAALIPRLQGIPGLIRSS